MSPATGENAAAARGQDEDEMSWPRRQPHVMKNLVLSLAAKDGR